MIMTNKDTAANKQITQLALDGTPEQRLTGRSSRHSLPLTFMQRDLRVINAIHEFGGVLTTVQLAVLFWPPDLRRRLIGWGIAESQVDEWLAHYPWGAINQQLELFKWLLSLNRLKHVARSSKADERVRSWLLELHKRHPDGFAEVDALMQEIEGHNHAQWLERSLTNGRSLPQAFVERPRLASEFVSSACKARLKALANANVIEPYEQATRLSDGRAQTCWFLTKHGRNLLAELKQVPVKELDFRPAGAYGTLHLNHRLGLNDFRIALLLACQHKGYTVKQWIDDNQLKRMLAKEKVALTRRAHDPQTGVTRDITGQHALKIPDGYFWLDLGELGQRHCFFEFDNQTLTLDYSTVSAKDYAQKIRTLSAFYRSGRYKEVFPEAGESMWYLTVTSGGEQRLNNLKKTAERVIGTTNRAADRYWFTRMAHIPTWEDYFSTGLFAPIWFRGGHATQWALDEPL
jgi:hypothetical protein